MNINFSWRMMAIGLLLVALVAAGKIASHYRDKYQEQTKATERLQGEVDGQASIIAGQSLQFNRFNQIAAAAGQYGVTVQAKTQEKEIEYRRIIEKEPTCDLLIPADIASGLLGYTYRLRDTALHANTSGANSDGSTATATSSITYCQAVLWIRPLLSAIEKANNQLNSIRGLELI
ncbi:MULTISPECIES: hypothetical protein [Hafniaceae]|uniref:hypothetical protein n=1 Tax=Hafniaceae TaxID=1903412 RepID=UPI000E00104D|nr:MULTISPECIES: hypothetical protein [Hafniaceae]TBL99898.1 hypothetical protein EYY93_12285 [Hafnia paralvei]STQ68389.1 Uncharacterised protein [Hafnia alvei]